MDVFTIYPTTSLATRQTATVSSHNERQEKAIIVQSSVTSGVVAISDRGKVLSAQAADEWKDPLDFLSKSEGALYSHLIQKGENGAAEIVRSIGAVRTGQMIGHPVTNVDRETISVDSINDYWSSLLGKTKEAEKGLEDLIKYI